MHLHLVVLNMYIHLLERNNNLVLFECFSNTIQQVEICIPVICTFAPCTERNLHAIACAIICSACKWFRVGKNLFFVFADIQKDIPYFLRIVSAYR